ncbi:MAG: DNA-binding transcriptional MocR family regulator [Saprospiraceae bacterium]|jgi:DNA-binding transcriptional MocR family regulator
MDIIEACRQVGTPNQPYVFTFTSKISSAGAGIACFASSPENIALAKKNISAQSIGPDKLNQLRHLNLYKDIGHCENI